MKAIGVPLMKIVLAKYPNLKLSLTESLSGATLLHLMASEVDLALVYNPPSEKELVTEPVLEEQMFCVGTAKLIGKSRAPISFDELAELPHIMLLQGLSSRALLDDPVRLKRLETTAILHLNSIGGTIGALLAGLGCAIATKLFVREQLAAATLVAREVVQPKLTRTLYLCRLRNRPMTYAMEEMRRLMLALIAEQVGQGGWEAKLLSRSPRAASDRNSRTLPSICSSGFLAAARTNMTRRIVLAKKDDRSSHGERRGFHSGG